MTRPEATKLRVFLLGGAGALSGQCQSGGRPCTRTARDQTCVMAVTAEFFPAWEPPPSFAAVPADAGLASRIDKLAEFASRNGPKFVQLTLQKQQGTDFEFLSGGEGSDYYRWILYCHLEQLDPGVCLTWLSAMTLLKPRDTTGLFVQELGNLCLTWLR